MSDSPPSAQKAALTRKRSRGQFESPKLSGSSPPPDGPPSPKRRKLTESAAASTTIVLKSPLSPRIAEQPEMDLSGSIGSSPKRKKKRKKRKRRKRSQTGTSGGIMIRLRVGGVVKPQFEEASGVTSAAGPVGQSDISLAGGPPAELDPDVDGEEAAHGESRKRKKRKKRKKKKKRRKRKKSKRRVQDIPDDDEALQEVEPAVDDDDPELPFAPVIIRLRTPVAAAAPLPPTALATAVAVAYDEEVDDDEQEFVPGSSSSSEDGEDLSFAPFKTPPGDRLGAVDMPQARRLDLLQRKETSKSQSKLAIALPPRTRMIVIHPDSDDSESASEDDPNDGDYMPSPERSKLKLEKKQKKKFGVPVPVPIPVSKTKTKPAFCFKRAIRPNRVGRMCSFRQLMSRELVGLGLDALPKKRKRRRRRRGRFGVRRPTAAARKTSNGVKRPEGFVHYTTIEATASVYPRRRFCDVTGLEGRYRDPRTKLQYHSASVHRLICGLESDRIAEGFLQLRSGEKLNI